MAIKEPKSRIAKESLNIAQQLARLLDYRCIGIAYNNIVQPALCPCTYTKRGRLVRKRRRQRKLGCLPENEDRNEVTLVAE